MYFLIFKWDFWKIMFSLSTSMLLAVEWYFAYQVKGIDVLYKKFKYFQKNKKIFYFF